MVRRRPGRKRTVDAAGPVGRGGPAGPGQHPSGAACRAGAIAGRDRRDSTRPRCSGNLGVPAHGGGPGPSVGRGVTPRSCRSRRGRRVARALRSRPSRHRRGAGHRRRPRRPPRDHGARPVARSVSARCRVSRCCCCSARPRMATATSTGHSSARSSPRPTCTTSPSRASSPGWATGSSPALHADPSWHEREFIEQTPQQDRYRDMGVALRRATPEFVDDLGRRIAAVDPDVVGFTSTFQQQLASLAAAQAVKQHAPHAVTVLGGGAGVPPTGAASPTKWGDPRTCGHRPWKESSPGGARWASCSRTTAARSTSSRKRPTANCCASKQAFVGQKPPVKVAPDDAEAT